MISPFSLIFQSFFFSRNYNSGNFLGNVSENFGGNRLKKTEKYFKGGRESGERQSDAAGTESASKTELELLYS